MNKPSENLKPVSSDEFRQALGNFASGVAVVISRGEGNRLHGITVSAFCSVSLEPPLILVCIEKSAGSHDSLGIGKFFTVNILHEDHEHISEKFASLDEDKFHELKIHQGVDELPLLSDAIANIECRVVGSYPQGDHTIFIGEVLRTRVGVGKPLLRFRGRYRDIG